ncbi:Nucleotide-binding protein [Seminavis robusta]|uniref:Nucleotide-binding protein n=1 Tax=Seminavis robusta TaxID=568900 RepID=A0A9N8DV20_9STRA|nr:Nucleotide-binding protein [Seminavis robusta]|eukprot:Sro364_g127080.1 Nucleotide-binding protein (242) ;mRNA; r:25020-25745
MDSTSFETSDIGCSDAAIDMDIPASPRSPRRTLHVRIETFGYKNGKPPAQSQRQMVLDCCGIPNPGTARSRKLYTGLNKDLAKDVMKDAAAQELINRGVQFVLDSISQLADKEETNEAVNNCENGDRPEGNSPRELSPIEWDPTCTTSNDGAVVILGYGCHAGLHRSVAIAQAAMEQLKEKHGIHRKPFIRLEVVHHSLLGLQKAPSPSAASRTYRNKKQEKRGRKGIRVCKENVGSQRRL